MALEDVLKIGIEAGARRFVLEDLSGDDEPPMWHWEAQSADPVKWFRLPTPTDLWIEWHGLGFGGDRPLGFLPFSIDWCRSLTLGVHVGCERAGWQGVTGLSIEEGLEQAVWAYICEFDISTCAHPECPDYQTCDEHAEDWL